VLVMHFYKFPNIWSLNFRLTWNPCSRAVQCSVEFAQLWCICISISGVINILLQPPSLEIWGLMRISHESLAGGETFWFLHENLLLRSPSSTTAICHPLFVCRGFCGALETGACLCNHPPPPTEKAFPLFLGGRAN